MVNPLFFIMKNKTLKIIGLYFLIIFVAWIIFYIPTLTETNEECWYDDGEGGMLPCKIDSGDHYLQTFIILSFGGLPFLGIVFFIDWRKERKSKNNENLSGFSFRCESCKKKFERMKQLNDHICDKL